MPNNDQMRSLITDSPMSRYGTPLNVEVVWLRHLMHLITKGRCRNTVPTQTSREHTLHKKPAGARINARHPAGSEAVVEGFEPPFGFYTKHHFE